MKLYVMLTALIGFVIQTQSKSLGVKYTDNGPRIDGVLDEVWRQADSAYDFVQYAPYEKEKSTEKTVVYVLQDHNNLYFAFVCRADSHKMTANLSSVEDVVAVGIDPFGSKTTAYYFLINGSGIIDDGWILDDGRTKDSSWDGVWFYAIKFYDDHFIAEMKIPFKTIRYKTGLDQWGVQFMREIADNSETDYWTEVLQKEDDMISRWPSMTGIRPSSSGYYFEAYPEGYVRLDRDWYRGDPVVSDSTDLKTSLSFNWKWDVTSQTTVNGTVYPDFAQIESDPYTLNLGRYPTFLDERRPFFLEGNDIFRMSDFGHGRGFFTPLNLFYSRRVGKSIDGEAIPIITGLKVASKTEDWNYGLLGAYTDEYEENSAVLEPDKAFGAFRVKRRLLQNSSVGMLFSGGAASRDEYNWALGMDGVYRHGADQMILQGAVSDRDGKRGWAASGGFFGFLGDFLTLGGASAIHDSFDVSDIGYVPWSGQKQVVVLSGPYRQFPRGIMSSLFLAPGAILIQEAGSRDWSRLGVLEFNPSLRNQWGCDLSLYLGKYYEADTNYLYRSVNLSTWGRLCGQGIEFGGGWSHCYNYWRGFLANQANTWFSYRYSFFEHMSAGVSLNSWHEWDPGNTLVATTSRLRPNLNLRFSAVMNLNVFTEMVMVADGIEIIESDMASVRNGFLFSWNFRPKSWIYVALNDYRAEVGVPGRVEPIYQVGAVKAKYLLYF